MKFARFLLSICLICLGLSCKKNTDKVEIMTSKTLIKYAKGFDIRHFNNFKILKIKSPYPNAKEEFAYVFSKDKKLVPDSLFEHSKYIVLPVEKLVVTSTTHIPMLELLKADDRLVGFPNLSYISSEKTRQLIAEGKIKELGKEENINTELLLELQPDLVVGFSMSSNNKMFTNIEKAGIPVALNGDWLEETPLGRAEWIKFFGLLFNKEKEADSIFKHIEKEYQEARLLAKDAESKPSILSGVQFKDVWNLPAGESFVARFLKDANTNYLWADTEGKGSLSLSFEAVFEKAQMADLWLAPGHFTGFNQLREANRHYTEFEAFKNKKVFSFNNKKGPGGGVLYYELALVQPHVVLKDIIKIAHPELLPGYEPYFLEKLQN